jgi:hypothetical protein
MQLSKLKFRDIDSYTHTKEMFEVHLNLPEVLEQDAYGVYVFRLADGNILKNIAD